MEPYTAMTGFEPAYLPLLHTGELANRVRQAYQRLEACSVCAWGCGANRRLGELGRCLTGENARVSGYGPHMGEENPLRGWRGSGTIFFSRCNLRCQYCQNHDISQADSGQLVEPEDLAAIMLELQEQGCHNINLVSPSHVVPQILAGVWVAAQAGLRLPLVYNSGGYDALATLALLDGVVDIYMPDMKYADAAIAERFSGIPNYPETNRLAVAEMHRQVGDLSINAQGLATRGLLVRHLVLPNGLAGTKEIVEFLAQHISPHTYLNLMDQYRPAYRAHHYPEMQRGLTRQEFAQALELARQAGLLRLDNRVHPWI